MLPETEYLFVGGPLDGQKHVFEGTASWWGFRYDKDGFKGEYNTRAGEKHDFPNTLHWWEEGTPRRLKPDWELSSDDVADLQDEGEYINDLLEREAPNSFKRVREFHETFGHPVSETPTVAEDGRLVLRLALILEEAIELADALGFATDDIKDSADYMLNKIGPRVYEDEIDIVAVADALGDLEYVTNGAALEMGINLPAVVKEIHRSNMTKLGPDGKPIYREDGKILKGEGYEPPNLEEVLGL